jgi:sugar lactone lactonase YvrE
VSSSSYWAQNATTVAGQADGTSGSSIHYLNSNVGISISNDDTLYIADQNNNRIVVVQLNGMANVSIIGSGSGSSASQFKSPSDVCVTNTSIYVMDTDNNRVQKWFRNGSNPTTMPGGSAFNSSDYLFVDKYMNLYVSNYWGNKVNRFAPNSSSPVRVAGNGIAGSAANQVYNPGGLFVDDAYTIYVADSQNNRIQKWAYNASSGITIAGTGVLGSSLKQLNYPRSLAVDANGHMYIADTLNHRILAWAPNATSGVCVAACTNTTGNRADMLNFPQVVAFDSNGSMYVSDNGNNRVQKFTLLNNTCECCAIE